MIEIKSKVNEALPYLAADAQTETLSESVRKALNNYFSQLKGEEPKEVYQMVLAEVEIPLLEVVLKHTKNNQVRTAKILGLSRGGLRDKLKAYGMNNEKVRRKRTDGR